MTESMRRNGWPTQIVAFFVLALACCLLNPTQAQVLDVPARPGPTYEIYKVSRALIISASEYEDSRWVRLPEAEADADRLAAFLDDNGFSEIVRVRDKSGAELREIIREFLVASPPDSRTIVYFAGHGATDQADKRRGYIVPVDAPHPERDLVGFRLRAISTIDLQNYAGITAAKHTLFIADSCFSGALIPSQGGYQTSISGVFPPQERYWEVLGLPRFQIISASEDWERIPPRSKLVERLIEGLSGAADTQGYGFTTAYNLSIWLRRVSLDDEVGTNPLYSSINLTNPVTNAPYPEGGDMVFATPKPTDRAKHTPGVVATIPDRGEAEAPPPENGLTAIAPPPSPPLPPPPSEPPPRPYESSHLGVFDPSEVFKGISVDYYKKTGDGVRVMSAMDRLGTPYTAKAALMEYDVTNAIACHQNVDIRALQALAIGLIEEGVQIRLIKQYEATSPPEIIVRDAPVPDRSGVIQLLSAKGGAFENAKPITVEQVKSMTGCPEWFQN